jgi:hypothetical protein
MKSRDLDCYHELHKRGLTTSLRHYSREWLGAAENYACARNGQALTPRVGLRLCSRLWDEGYCLLALRIGWRLMRSESDRPGEPVW